ncbi:MAG: FtsW/RodA/SpoVE family cell cycle protein [Bacillota bacterium]|nr:FtsW/RodA/SpoVE family cell cycle protein [Bacillota bacterium]
MKKVRKSTPLVLLALMNILGYSMLAMNADTFYSKVEIGIIGFLFLCLMFICFFLIKLLNMGDNYLFLPVAALLSVGLLMLMRIDDTLGKKQMIWFCASAVCYFLAYAFYRSIKVRDKLFWVYFGVSALLFAGTLILGTEVNGSKNWIFIGTQGFQPSELIKLLFVLGLACLFEKEVQNKFMAKTAKNLLIMCYVYVNLGFLVLQREWGIATLFFLVYMAMMFVFGSEIKIMVLNALIVTAGGFGGYKLLYHIQTRVDMWINPFSDATGRGFQIVQSLIAIASGSFAGLGFLNGSPEYIPEVQSDFIFSEICEEFGILGGVGVIMLFFILAYRGFKITLSVKDRFDKLTALGITAIFSFQTFIILGGVIKLIPLTGITLPFISYGGSSLLTSFMALGLLQAVSKGTEDELV